MLRGVPGRFFTVVTAIFAASLAFAQTRTTEKEMRAPVYVEPGPVVKSVLRVGGQEVDVATQIVWRPICGSDSSRITVDDLRLASERARQAELNHPAPNGGVAATTTGFDLVFNFTSALPPGAAAAIANVEHYIEAQFSDPISITVNLGFTSLAPGTLGSTGSNLVIATWANARNALQADMDPDDTIQSFLPAGGTIPVRYNGLSSTVTNEDRVFVTVAAYRAGIGTVPGTAAVIQMNSDFNWDYTPPNISSGSYCFQSVLAHEIGHVLGFESGVGAFSSDIELLDIFRFQNSDGTGTDHNPDTLAEFQTTARLSDVNAPLANDDVNSDLITAEYRMSDGAPYQGSHFTNSLAGVYVMAPALSSGVTYYPDFYRVGDSVMFDAIGWDFPPQNTACENAIPLQCGSVKSFDTTTNNLAPNPAYSCGVGTAQQGTMWYSFVPSNPTAQVSTCGSEGTDTTFAVYSGECGDLTEVVCAEDGGCSTKPGLSTVCMNNLLVGETYYVQVSSRSPVDQRLYLIQFDCDCPGACCLPPPGNCTVASEGDCAALGGGYSGPGSQCLGDQNEDQIDDTCEEDHVEFSQLPTPAAEDSASNIDPDDLDPAMTVSDDFVSDGRPIHTVRWWGSALDPGVSPDGWFVGFYEPLTEAVPPATPLGLYYCDQTIVTATTTPIPSCDAHTVIGYEARLHDCCMLHSTPDSRTSGLPAEREAFYQELCLDYDLAIHALAGRRYERDNLTGECVIAPTATNPTGDFWGWHRTSVEQGVRAALQGPVTTSGGEWLAGPMSLLVTDCGPINAAFELVTTTLGGESHPAVWDNGLTNGVDLFGSQSDGQETDWLTVDDFTFPAGGLLNDFSAVFEEEPAFVWSGRLRVEVYPDTGSLTPDESGGPFAALWVPDDVGAVTRTDLGPGTIYNRWRYEVTGLNLTLSTGRWWLGLAPAGETGGTGRTYWTSSHSVPPGTLLYGGQAHLRAPSAAVASFTPWSAFAGGRQSDVSVTITTSAVVDCNCNGVDDQTDVISANSLDCNANLVPDECEYDCNTNGIPDECEIAGQTATDCQPNGIIDACEVILGLVDDVNHNGIPDECCEVSSAPTPQLNPVNRNRTITINPGQPGQRTALRVRLVNLQDPTPPNSSAHPPRDFSAFENTYRWVGPPQAYPEGSGAQQTFSAAPLQCSPFFTDWSGFEVLHVYGPEIMPSSEYEVQAIEEVCYYFGQPTAYSPPLTMNTARWGDIASPYQPPAEGIQPDALDVVGVVNKFRGVAGAPIQASSRLQPALLDFAVNLSALDIVSCVDAFRGLAYPYQGVVACPP